MLNAIFLATLMSLQPPTAPPTEPDQSRPIGIVPPFKGEPAPPVWLRTESHTAAQVDCRHYLYEAYAGPDDTWLVRYRMMPEEGETARRLEQFFQFGSKPGQKPQEVPVAEPVCEGGTVTWKGKTFKLVDRRDLMRP